MDADAAGSAAAHDWQSPGGAVERLVFGTREQPVIDAAVDAFCRAQLGAGVAEVLLRASSAGVVYGARLEDQRRVVVKAHQPRESAAFLQAAQRVQAHLHREGFPCPAPLAGPAELVNGLAVAEELVDAGKVRDTHEPACRRAMAEALAWHLELARGGPRPEALAGGWSLFTPGRLWPAELHSPMLDFEATAQGARWIDDIAATAKARLVSPGELVVGHHDWSGKHVRFAGDRVSVVYDWDSLRLGAEAVIVGNAAMTFTTNFDVPGVTLAPTPDEVRAFVDEYSAARPTALRRHAREQIAACATLIAAYTARCEHSLHRTDDPTSFTWALRTHAEEYLQLG